MSRRNQRFRSHMARGLPYSDTVCIDWAYTKHTYPGDIKHAAYKVSRLNLIQDQREPTDTRRMCVLRK